MNSRNYGIVAGLVVAFMVGVFADRMVSDAWTASPSSAKTAQANEDSEGRKCSNRTLRGTYGVKAEGQSPVGPFASASQFKFDGNGKFSAFEIGSLNGQIVERTIAGDYTVNSDCGGTITFPSEIVPGSPHQAHGDIVLVDSGKEFYFIDHEEGWILNGVGKKF
jgi:hypothetical protein